MPLIDGYKGVFYFQNSHCSVSLQRYDLESLLFSKCCHDQNSHDSLVKINTTAPWQMEQEPSLQTTDKVRSFTLLVFMHKSLDCHLSEITALPLQIDRKSIDQRGNMLKILQLTNLQNYISF